MASWVNFLVNSPHRPGKLLGKYKPLNWSPIFVKRNILLLHVQYSPLQIGVYYIKLSFSDRIWVWYPRGSPTWQHRVEDEVLSGRTTSWILHEDPTWKRQLRISTPCVAMNLVDFDSLHRCSQCAPDYLTLISTAAIDIHCCDWCRSVRWRWNITTQEY